MGRLRSYLLLTLVTGVLVGWAAAIGSGRLFDTWAFFKDTESDTGNTITAATLAAPTLNDLTVNSATEPGSLTLTWTPASDAANQIEIHRATGASSCGAFSLYQTVSETPTSYTDSGLTAGVYCYKIRGKLNGWTSAFSATKSATIVAPITQDKLYPTTALTLATSPGSGTVTIDARVKEPFDFRVWQSASVKVLKGTAWTLRLDLDTSTPFQSATVTVELWLLANGSCGTSAPAGAALVTPTTTTLFADGQINLPAVSGSGTTDGILCLKITNIGGNENNGVSHAARIITGIDTWLFGYWDALAPP